MFLYGFSISLWFLVFYGFSISFLLHSDTLVNVDPMEEPVNPGDIATGGNPTVHNF